MKISNLNFKIGNWQIQGIWAIIIGIILLIPILTIVGTLLSVVFSIVGFVLTLIIGVIAVGLIIALIASLLPEKLRKKLDISLYWTRHYNKPKASKPHTTSDGHPIIDVTFEEENKK